MKTVATSRWGNVRIAFTPPARTGAAHMKTVATSRWGKVRISDGSVPPEENVETIADTAKKKFLKEVPSAMDSEGDEEAIAKAARDKANKMTPQPGKNASNMHTVVMTPQGVADALRVIAAKIGASKQPNPALLFGDIKYVLDSIPVSK